MNLKDFLQERISAHLPLAGVFDERGILRSPDVFLSGTYDAGLGDAPLLYGACISFSAYAVREGVFVDVLPDPTADSLFGPMYRSVPLTLVPGAAGSYSITRAPHLLNDRLQLFHEASPFAVSDLIGEHDNDLSPEEGIDAVVMLAHLGMNDVIRMYRQGMRTSVVSVRKLLDLYAEITDDMSREFDARGDEPPSDGKDIVSFQRLAPADVEVEHDRFKIYDEYHENLMQDPDGQIWEGPMSPAEYYRHLPQRHAPARRLPHSKRHKG